MNEVFSKMDVIDHTDIEQTVKELVAHRTIIKEVSIGQSSGVLHVPEEDFKPEEAQEAAADVKDADVKQVDVKEGEEPAECVQSQEINFFKKVAIEPESKDNEAEEEGQQEGGEGEKYPGQRKFKEEEEEEEEVSEAAISQDQTTNEMTGILTEPANIPLNDQNKEVGKGMPEEKPSTGQTDAKAIDLDNQKVVVPKAS